MLITKAYRLKLYPTVSQCAAFVRWSGVCRWVWNHFVELERERYASDKKFIFRFDLDKMLPTLKAEHDWISEPPACCLQRIAFNVDAALKRAISNKANFPQFKGRSGRRSFYLSSNSFRLLESKRIKLPKIGTVRFRTGSKPQGRVLNATISLEGSDWYCTVQCETEIDVVSVPIDSDSIIGIDAGLSTLATMSDGSVATIPKTALRRERKLRRLRKRVSRSQKGSANREKSRSILATALHREANRRRDARHKATREIVNRASAIVLEDLNVSGIGRMRNLGAAVARTGMGEMRRQIEYKAQWSGKVVILADRFFPSTQTCSACGQVKRGTDRLRLHNRVFECGCGHVTDRDLNAAMNLRRYGLIALGLLTNEADEPLGQAMPQALERPRKACGDPSTGPFAPASGRYGSVKQESTRLAASNCLPIHEGLSPTPTQGED